MPPLGEICLRALVATADLVWPPRCVVCDALDVEARPLCTRCAVRLPPPGPRCTRCGRGASPLTLDAACRACAGEPTRLAGVVAAWSYAGLPRDLVLALKFRRRLPAARPLAEALGNALEVARIPGDLLVPVPLSGRRLAGRGFNQSEVLARHLAGRLGVGLAPRALRRRRHTRPQATLHGARRRRAQRGSFRASRPRVAGRCVLLVDDVLTTGATLEAAALALRRAGALAVTAAVACRTEGAGRPLPAARPSGILASG